ncbi:MAG: 1-acyl-sn-glycerol-3-phosphate acyltransferase, partial [Oscillospiraceae bacterium]
TEIPKTSLQKPKRFLLKQMIVSGEEFHEIMDAKPAGNNVTAAVREAIARVSGSKDFSDDTRLFQELAIDSLGALDLACEIDEKCGVYLEHLLHKDMTVGELIECVISPVVGEQAPPENPYPMRKKKFAYQFFCIFRNLIRGFYKVKVKNDTVLPENSGYIICANHVSNFDYLYLTLNFKKERFLKFCCMAKKELFRKNAFSKLLANICGMIPVDRGGLVADTMEAINGKLKEKWGILIHPEGTRSGNGKMGAFKNGAAVIAIDADVPIVPAYIRGGFDIFPRTKKLPFLYNWKAKCKYQVDVIYGEPILPAGKSPEELMNAIKAAITLLSSSETVVAAN